MWFDHRPEVLTQGHTRLMKAVRDANARAGDRRKLTLECQVRRLKSLDVLEMNMVL